MKVILFANTDWYLYNYRMPLGAALRERQYDVVMMSPYGEYAAQIQAAGFRWIEFPLSRRGKNPLVEILTIKRIFDIYRNEKPDSVQHFTIKCAIYGSIAGRIAGVDTIINAIPGLGHVFIDSSLYGKIIRRVVVALYRIALKNTKVIFQNPDDQKLFLEQHIVTPEQQVLIKGSGVDIELFQPLPEADGTIVVALPARMLWAKGIAEFVDAARKIKMIHSTPVRFVLVGDSDPNTAGSVPQSQLKAWHEEGDIEWWGWQKDIKKIFKQAHIICLPSYYGEGVPRSLVEAAACGRPVVAADMPGGREIVHHGENGLLVKPRDVQDLVEALLKLIDDAHLRQRMGKRGREIVTAEFSLETTINRNLELFY